MGALPPSQLERLECSSCGETRDPGQLQNLCPCGRPLLARYRLQNVPPLPPGRPGEGMWRYSALLPHQGHAISLGEGGTPLLAAPRLAAALGVAQVSIKDEAQNPTVSFKSRGLSAATTMARALGVTRVAIPTAGNAGGALAAYGARAGMEVDVFMPADTPESFALEAALHGARVHRVEGLIDACGARVAEGVAEGRWFDVSTLKEPYRLEGKKTMGLELWEQTGGELPDVLFYPTGGGTGLVGMWKAWSELEQLGWFRGPRPRMVAVQAEGCAPVVRAWQEGAQEVRPWLDASTSALGLRVPRAVGDRMMLSVLRESNGAAVAVSESDLLAGMYEINTLEGIAAGPETGALVAATRALRNRGELSEGAKIAYINTGSGHKMPAAMRRALESGS